MKILVVIPAYNEEAFIGQTLESLLTQQVVPDKIIVVDDNSTDRTAAIVEAYAAKGPIELVKNQSTAENLPGSKVVAAFQQGLEQATWKDYDIICKFDADLIFPSDYLAQVLSRFREKRDIKIGMVAGHCSIYRKEQWVLENQNNPDHIRGALKAYHRECFTAIGGLRKSIGWDTMDEMLARFYGWEVVTIPDLWVKHLKPTGAAYTSRSKYLQGEAFYKMRYGYVLTLITAAKMAWNKKEGRLITDYLKGYYRAKRSGLSPLVTEEQGRFIRKYRWSGIKTKLGF